MNFEKIEWDDYYYASDSIENYKARDKSGIDRNWYMVDREINDFFDPLGIILNHDGLSDIISYQKSVIRGSIFIHPYVGVELLLTVKRGKLDTFLHYFNQYCDSFNAGSINPIIEEFREQLNASRD